MKTNKYFPKRMLAVFVGSLFATSAFAFNPADYETEPLKPIKVDGVEMVKLRVYAQDQRIEFKPEDIGQDVGDFSNSNRAYTADDEKSVGVAMQYVKAVFGAPSKAPIIETFTNKEDNASFSSAVVSGGQSRLGTWFVGKSPVETLPVGILEIGDLGSKDSGKLRPLPAKGVGANLSSVVVHEMMHGMGIMNTANKDKENNGYREPDNIYIYSTHLYDVFGHQMKPKMPLVAISDDDLDNSEKKADTTRFYQLKGSGSGGAYFTGDEVKKVLTVGGQEATLAWADDADVKAVPGIPINGYEDEPELSHIELQNSIMSHQTYRNWGTFMEAELALLQDIGYEQIDRRQFFGFSIYNNGLTYTNTNGFNSSQDWGIGLHVYGSNNTVVQQAAIQTTGTDAIGIRMEGVNNALTIAKETHVQANGTDGIGVLVSYGKEHALNIQGTVEASGTDGDALRLDFGGNSLGDGLGYRGSYFNIQLNDDDDDEEDDDDDKDSPGVPENDQAQANDDEEEADVWHDVDSKKLLSALNGPLAKRVDISGQLKGKHAAIHISDNAFVKQINVLNGAILAGDIISEWSPKKNRYGEYNENMKLHLPKGEDGVTVLTFGLKADDQGQATETPDPDARIVYNGSIKGQEGLKIDVKGGELAYGGTADVLALAIRDRAQMGLSGSASVSTSSTAMEGESTLALMDESQANLGTVNVLSGASPNLAVRSDQAKIQMQALENQGDTHLVSSSAKAERFRIGTYQGNEGASLTLTLDQTAANQFDGNDAGQSAKQGAKVLKIDNNATESNWNLEIAEGDISGAVSAVIDPEGNPIKAHERQNSTAAVLQDIAANNFQVFRAQMNDLDKRMGDLRNMPATSGAWAKVIAGQSQYKSVHNNYKTLQVGVDHRIDNFFAGVTAAYTDGDGSIKHGSTDDKNYTFGLYGGWLGDDGQFVDVTLKRHHLETDYDFRTQNGKSKGSYDTSGTSFSIEYGWRLGIADTNYYLEPQAEFMYGHLNSTQYTTSRGVKVDQSSVKSAVGRLGIAAGWLSPDKTGNVYVKASVLNDWEADAVIRTRKGNANRRYHEDMGGTWGEFAVGGTYQMSKHLSAYGEMETTVGNPVRTTYQFNAGLRLSF